MFKPPYLFNRYSLINKYFFIYNYKIYLYRRVHVLEIFIEFKNNKILLFSKKKKTTKSLT